MSPSGVHEPGTPAGSRTAPAGTAASNETGEPPICSVVIPNYNARRFLAACLGRLANQTFESFEVILVDNGSTDGSLDFVRSHFPDVRTEALDRNYGFATAVNRGISLARGSLVALLNADTEPDDDWLAELVAALARRPDAALADSKIIMMRDRRTLDSVGELYSRWGYPAPRGRGDEESRYTEPEEVFGVCGGAMIARMDVLERIGGFDEDFFIYYEDVDLSFRARLAGFKCLNVPASRVYHHLGGTTGGVPAFVRYLSLKNAVLLYAKNMPAGLVPRTLPRFLVIQLLLCAAAARRGHLRVALRAYAYLLRHAKKLKAERRRVQRLKQVGDDELYASLDPRLPPAVVPAGLRGKQGLLV